MWLLEKMLRSVITRGQLTVYEADGKRHDYGAPDPALRAVTVRFTDKRAPDQVVYGAGLGPGEAYMNGRMRVDGDDIRGLIDLVYANSAWDQDRPNGLGEGRLVSARRELVRWLHNNTPARSKRNVAHHYDLSDRLYDLFLDADRQYSCAYWTDPEQETLEQAQLDKKAHIAAKLNLKPGLKLLDIGCGWGGMALYLNRVADVDVLGITLSEEQLKVARRRAEEAGVADRVKFELIDYRSLTGRFDRIVSVGMFEHVGTRNYPTFFACVRRLLAEDGVMLLHTIGRMGRPSYTDAWTEKYIFPGGYCPALSEIVRTSERERLIASDVETLRLHYAYTIDAWYDRVFAARDEIEQLYDKRFFLMWTYYLAGAAVAFRYGDHCNFQIQYIRRRDALPITRDYMATAEAALLAKG